MTSDIGKRIGVMLWGRRIPVIYEDDELHIIEIITESRPDSQYLRTRLVLAGLDWLLIDDTLTVVTMNGNFDD